MRVYVSDQQHPDWDRFVERSTKGTFFHLQGWKEIIRHSYGHQAFYMVAERDGLLCGVLPLFLISSRLFGRTLVSMPFVDFGGVCAVDDEAADGLLKAAEDKARELNVQCVEFRHLTPARKEMPSIREKVSMVLELPASPDELWSKLPLKRRSRIRKAQASGLTVRIQGGEVFQEFYSVFARNMRDLGSPVHSLLFFEKIASVFPSQTKIVLVSSGKKTIGAAWCLCFKDRFMVPWSSCLRGDFGSYPNFLLFWAALEHACKEGYRRFDFGRSSVGSGTYEFKRGWGAQAQPLHWQYVAVNGNKIIEPGMQQARFGIFVKLWKALPIGIANRIGPRIRKYISL